MAPLDQLPPAPRLCPQCNEVLDLKSPHVEITGSAVRVYCSDDCRRLALTEPVVLPPPPPVVAEPRRRHRALRLSLIVMVAALLLLGGDSPRLVSGDELRDAVDDVRVATAPEPEVEPEPDPAELAAAEAEAERARWTAALSNDRWVHPLAGPKRRMPARVSRVFGAQRPGHRPIECHAGHCGVDIGGEVWGEPVLAAHGGVVERVQRDPHRGRGGMYVRLSHRDGTVFTQYFHLAAIPRSLGVGDEVSAGEVIGLLGATGIRHSEAHLHFTVSVRSDGEGPEQFIDPEPLIALWPVAVPVFGDVGSIARAHTIPGHPVGPYGKKKKRKRRARRAAAREVPSAAKSVEGEPKAEDRKPKTEIAGAPGP